MLLLNYWEQFLPGCFELVGVYEGLKQMYQTVVPESQKYNKITHEQSKIELAVLFVCICCFCSASSVACVCTDLVILLVHLNILQFHQPWAQNFHVVFPVVGRSTDRFPGVGLVALGVVSLTVQLTVHKPPLATSPVGSRSSTSWRPSLLGGNLLWNWTPCHFAKIAILKVSLCRRCWSHFVNFLPL